MYNEYFRFDSFPFLNTADPGFWFNSYTHREALAVLVYGIREGKGLTVITGGVGTGKTMLVAALRAESDAQSLFVEISSPWVSSDEVFASIWHDIGLPVLWGNEPPLLSKPGALKTLKERLIQLSDEGRRVVLVVDEAHQLPEKTLEGIRLFADLETPTKKLLQVILLGQEELRSALDGHSLRALRDRIALSHHLQSLSLQDTEEYIRHRIRFVGGNPAVFSTDCFPIIFEVTRGSPRAINYFCDQCLLFALGKNLYQLDTALLREVAARSVRQSSPPVVDVASARSTKGAFTPEVNADQQPGETVSAGPRTPTPTHEEFVALPFRLPATGHKARSGPNVDPGTLPESHSAGAFPYWQVMVTLATGLSIGAVLVWVLVGNGLPISLNLAKKDTVAPMPMPMPMPVPVPVSVTPGRETVNPALEVDHVMQPTPMPLNPPNPTANQSLARLSLPNVLGNPGKIKEITLGPASSLAGLATVQYGAWNATVRDIISDSNPALGDLEKIPEGTRISLPKLDRGSMVVASDGKRYFIYYGSYESMDMANQDAEALKRLSTSAVVVQVQGARAGVSRVFVGPYDNRIDADTVATSLWFKYLPGLN